MILLSGHSLTPARRVPLESLSLSLKERDSTATMVPADMTGITTESWFLDDVNPGENIVWRVKSIQTDYATNTPTVQLEHAICSLRDAILFGEITPAKIAGKSATTCTAKEAVQYILKQQSDWKLGTFGFTVSNAYKFEGDSLYDALETVSGTLEDAWWSYDMTKYPFTLNIIKKPAGVTCELRPGRNLQTVSKMIDRSKMYTRFYPIGKNDLHISGSKPYVERNTSSYGVICKVETDTTLETEAALKARANERLKIHAQPAVSITADGMELADATGEPLDRLTLGRICRIPLADFNTVIEERIVELSYSDKVHEPEKVRITLSNEQDDVVKIIADAIKEGAGSSGKASRSGARKAKEDNAWFEDTDEHVAMCARGIIGTDGKGNPNWERLSKIVVDGKGIHQTVEEIQDGNVVRDSKIEQNEKGITLEANERSKQDGLLQGKIEVSSSKINLVVGEYADGSNYIRGAKICLAINDSGSSALIDADHIRLVGTTTVNDILTVTSRKAHIKTDMLVSGDAQASTLTLRSGADSITLTEANLETVIKRASVSGNTLTLTPMKGEAITFSKAAGPITLAWNSSNNSVKATASGATTEYYHVMTNFYNPSSAYYIGLFHTDEQGNTNWLTGSGHRIALKRTGSTVKIVDPSQENDPQYPQSPTYTIPLKSETFDTDGTYTPPAGYVGYSSVTVAVDSSYSGRTFNCTKKENTYPGSSTYIYTFTLEGNYGFTAGSAYTLYRTSWPT